MGRCRMTATAAQDKLPRARSEADLLPGPYLQSRRDAPATLARLRARLADGDRYDLAVAALLAVLVALAFATLRSYAVSSDEQMQQRYGELIVSYYASGFADQQLFHYVNLYLYGGLFDILAVLVGKAAGIIGNDQLAVALL